MFTLGFKKTAKAGDFADYKRRVACLHNGLPDKTLHKAWKIHLSGVNAYEAFDLAQKGK